MKKQINPTIKAHLIRSAFYLLVLLAICAIPFALAQSRSRGTAKRNVAKPAASSNLAANAHLTPLSNLKPASNPGAGGPQVAPPASGAQRAVPAQLSGVHAVPAQASSRVTSGPTGVSAVRSLRMPTFPQVVLYDQYDNDLNNGIVSANRTDNPPLSAEAADNFVVPGGETWNVTEVDIRSAPGFPAPTSFAPAASPSRATPITSSHLLVRRCWAQGLTGSRPWAP